MKITFCIVFFLVATGIHAQYSLFGGMSMLRPFGANKSYYGLNLGVEIPKDDQTSLYLRVALYKKRTDGNSQQSVQLTNLDPNDYTLQFVDVRSTMNYSTFEGGIRRYLGTYDNAFSLYGGTNVMGALSVLKMEAGEYDKSKYALPPSVGSNTTMLSIGVGLNGGAKYTFAGRGTVFFDISMDYLLRGLSSQALPSGFYYSPLLTTFSIGFRKEFY